MSDEQKESIIKSYSKVAKGSSAVIMDEMNAHYIEGQLKNKNLLEALLSDEPTLKDKILSFFKGASTDYAGNAELSGAAKRLFKRYKKLFDSFSAQNQDTNAYGAAVMNSAEQDGKRFALSYTTDNKAVAVIENDIFDGKFDELTESERIKIVKAAIKEFRPGIPISGRLIGVSRKTAGHFTNSDYTDKIRNNDQNLYKDKLNIAQNIDDVIYASANYINEDLKHPRNDNITQFARGTVLLDIAGNKYKADVLVGYTSMNDMILYDVQDLTPTKFSIKEKKAQSKLAGNESYTRKTIVPSTNSIPEKSQNVNTNSEKNSAKRFALPEGVDIEEIPDYNEKQYNDFGWARGNGILSKTENARLRTLFADVVSKQGSPKKTKYGEYMIAVGDIADNKIAYMKGTIDEPIITRILEIDLDNETDLAEKRSEIYALERRGLRQTTGVLLNAYSIADAPTYVEYKRKGTQNERHNNGLGADRRTGTGKAETTSKRITPYLPIVQTFTDISGRKRNVIRVDGKFMIEGNDHARYSATIEDAVSSENKRIIDRYARKYNSTAGIVRKKLTADPDFLKSEWESGKRFALPEGDAALEELLAERDALESAGNSFDAEAIVSKGKT